MSVQLIVGLGNPGPEYHHTRHNAGAIFLEELARRHGATFTPENKFSGLVARARIDGHDVRLLQPTTFMNLSGQSVGPLAGFFKIAPENILIAYDEIDLPPGTARLKAGGGAGGHNGIKDVIKALGNQSNFYRLRIGVGHPGDKSQVANYVLRKAPQDEQNLIDDSIDRALDVMPLVLNGEWEKAMKELHTKK